MTTPWTLRWLAFFAFFAFVSVAISANARAAPLHQADTIALVNSLYLRQTGVFIWPQHHSSACSSSLVSSLPWRFSPALPGEYSHFFHYERCPATTPATTTPLTSPVVELPLTR